MKRLEVRLRPLAVDDLADIFEYILLQSRHHLTAERYVARLTAACYRVGDAAEAGRLRPDLGPGLRMWSFERRVTIIYRIEFETVAVQRLFYAGRQVDFHLRAVAPSEREP